MNKNKKKKKPIEMVVDVVFIVCIGISVIATVVYLITKRVVPGLSPFSLAIALFIISGGMRMNRDHDAEGTDFIELVFMIAALLNVFVGFMQIHAYMLGH